MFVKAIGILLIAYVLFLLFLVLFQRQIMYHPTKHILGQPPAPFQEILAETSDGLSLKAWYAAPEQNKPNVLFFHGNGATIEWRLPKVRAFLQQGYGVYLAEYRGYGGNKGSPTETGLKLDAQAHYKALNKLEKNIVTYGESLGTHLALYIATQHHVKGVVLENAYTSMHDLARKRYPAMPIPASFIHDKYDSLLIAPKLNSPVLQLHAAKDLTVPISFGKRLYSSIDATNVAPKKWVKINGVGHNNIYDAPETLQAVITFLESLD